MESTKTRGSNEELIVSDNETRGCWPDGQHIYVSSKNGDSVLSRTLHATDPTQPQRKKPVIPQVRQYEHWSLAQENAANSIRDEQAENMRNNLCLLGVDLPDSILEKITVSSWRMAPMERFLAEHSEATQVFAENNTK
ncbi:hypothetical protein Dda_3701 [Drechslerella dactyloides]|uniref:Uncharacterized protein n=1 Tax=Drechslerella dactyloides TaxID=74499 RepID=A0AAD6IYW3_DREDA|nr:hypothetical protein Dda_3701 [Drechslerella dactyloides]